MSTSMFWAAVKKAELARLQRRFDRKLRPFITKKCNIIVGHPGGSWEETVYYSQELNIWWTLNIESKGKRYWNAFGIGEPHGHVNIIVEINYPVEGSSFYVAANWARDEDANWFLFHSGKIGGGKKGVGQAAFIEQYSGGGRFSIQVDGYPRETSLIADANDEKFAYQVSSFVFAVAAFKGFIAPLRVADFDFKKEFDGTKIYQLPNKMTANANHGIIVNQLQILLKSKNFLVGNNGPEGRIDLFVYKKSRKITHLFEVKSSLSLQALCAAIGQLFLYSNNITPRPLLTIVCPGDIPRKVSDTLKVLGINVVTFTTQKGQYTFHGIDRILNQ